MKNIVIISFFIFSTLTFTHSFGQQILAPESCDCTIDTAGYSSFVSTLTISEVPMQFHVHNSFAVAIGYINGSTPNAVSSLISNNPNVTTIVLLDSGGSDDDEANLQASQMIYNAGLKMFLPSNGFIASGAVDMFLAGNPRVIEAGAQVGVHSWGGPGGIQATDFPVGHAYHQPYIDYYMSVGFSQSDAEDFYYYTINAAPAAGIHWMSENDINLYKVRSCTYSSTPQYMIHVNEGVLTAATPNATYQWLDCTNGLSPINSETNQSFTPSSNGEYAVEITEESCSGTTQCIVFNSLSTDELVMPSIQLYPNPVIDDLHIELQENTPSTTVSILSLNGQLISRTQYINQSVITHPVNLLSGYYFVHVQTATESTFKKILVD